MTVLTDLSTTPATGARAFKHQYMAVYLKFSDQDLQDIYASVPF